LAQLLLTPTKVEVVEVEMMVPVEELAVTMERGAVLVVTMARVVPVVPVAMTLQVKPQVEQPIQRVAVLPQL
jgi:hypothetical protein